MSKRFMRQEEIKLIKQSLLINRSQIKNDVEIIFNNKLEKFEKLTPYEYDEAIRLLRLCDTLYDELNKENINIIITEENVHMERVSE